MFFAVLLDTHLLQLCHEAYSAVLLSAPVTSNT